VLAGICVLSAFAAEKDMMRALLDEHQAGACAFIGQVRKAKSPVSGWVAGSCRRFWPSLALLPAYRPSSCAGVAR
jgi:hypothetical protein